MYCIVLKIVPCRKPHAAPDASMDSTCSAWMPSSKQPGTRNDIYKNLILMIQLKCLCMDRFQVFNLCMIIHDWFGFPYLHFFASGQSMCKRSHVLQDEIEIEVGFDLEWWGDKKMMQSHHYFVYWKKRKDQNLCGSNLNAKKALPALRLNGLPRWGIEILVPYINHNKSDLDRSKQLGDYHCSFFYCCISLIKAGANFLSSSRSPARIRNTLRRWAKNSWFSQKCIKNSCAQRINHSQ